MSDSGGGSLAGVSARLLIFVVLLVISSPFLAIGYYKNGVVKAAMDKGINFMGEQKYVEARQEFETAADSLGVLYDCYVAVLPIVGGKYYDKKNVVGLRGAARAFAIGEEMAKGNFDVADEIEEAERDITSRGKFPTGTGALKELSAVSLRSYRVLLLIHEDFEKKDSTKAFVELSEMVENNPHVIYPTIALPVCYLLHQAAIKLKTVDAIVTAKVFIMTMKGTHKHPLFAKFALAIDPIMPPSEQPRQVNSNAPQTLKDKYQLGLAHAKRQNFAKAAPILEDCHATEPHNNVIAYTLALVKRKMGQNEDARKLCEDILARSPDEEKASKLLAALGK